MNLIFLDIDGVFNNHPPLCVDSQCGTIDRDKVRLFNEVLRRTGANVVLSSAWRYFFYRGEMSLRGIEWLLRSHGMMSGRLIGITDADTLVRCEKWDYGKPWPMTDERGSQITKYLERFRSDGGEVKKYVVVDDLDLGIVAAGHPFVRTDGNVGLTEADCRKMVELLNP